MKHSLFKAAIITAITAAISACATSPTQVTAEGTTDNPVWPKWDSVTLHNNRGTFPNLTSLREVKAGITKDQLYHLLGRPHYHEVWRPREWNYLFHFHTPGIGTDGVTTCQFKVLFDKDTFTRSFFWNPIDPIDAACPAVYPEAPPPQPQIIIEEVAVPVEVPVQVPVEAPKASPKPQIQRYTLNADALFAFDKYKLSDMLPGGRHDLNQLVEYLNKFEELNGIIITGHTDKLGSDAYNQKLSENRANTVVDYLVSQGIPRKIIYARGAGEKEPIHQCSDKLPRKQLITCLQPNRRVTVDVDGYGIVENQSH